MTKNNQTEPLIDLSNVPGSNSAAWMKRDAPSTSNPRVNINAPVNGTNRPPNAAPNIFSMSRDQRVAYLASLNRDAYFNLLRTLTPEQLEEFVANEEVRHPSIAGSVRRNRNTGNARCRNNVSNRMTSAQNIQMSYHTTVHERTNIVGDDGVTMNMRRKPSAMLAKNSGLPPGVVQNVHVLDVELEGLRHSLMRNNAGQNTINSIRRQELHLLIDTYLNEVDTHIKAKDAKAVVETIRRYRRDRRDLEKRHRNMDREHEQRVKFENMARNGDVDGIKQFIRNDQRRKKINRLAPEVSNLINKGKHKEAAKLWNKQMQNVENESTSKSFKRRVKNAVKSGSGIGSAFKVKFRGPSFKTPESQWVLRNH